MFWGVVFARSSCHYRVIIVVRQVILAQSSLRRFIAGAIVAGAIVVGAIVTPYGAFVVGAIIAGAFIVGAIIAGAFIVGAIIAGAIVVGVNFAGAIVAGVNFVGAFVAEQLSRSNCRLQRSNCRRSNYRRSICRITVALCGFKFLLDHFLATKLLLVLLYICLIAHLYFHVKHRRGVGLVGGALGLGAVIVQNVF